MNGSDQNYQPSPDLPPPHQEGLNPLGVEKTTMPAMKAEVAGRQVEMPAGGIAASGVPSMPFGAAPTTPPPVIATNPTLPTTTNIPVSDGPAVADDGDLIEKEWVSKAKYIVDSTREDPHLQNKEMNKFKADYIQKRYNKQLKVSDD